MLDKELRKQVEKYIKDLTKKCDYYTEQIEKDENITAEVIRHYYDQIEKMNYYAINSKDDELFKPVTLYQYLFRMKNKTDVDKDLMGDLYAAISNVYIFRACVKGKI